MLDNSPQSKDMKQLPLLFAVMAGKTSEDYTQSAYSQRDTVFTFVRKVMSIPFLPAEHVEPAIMRLKEKTTDERLADLL
ncbi:hypothetical protein DPMN_155661, partial [Dreissena polymorpha]